MPSPSIQKRIIQLTALLIISLALNPKLNAQSLDARSPSPVKSNEIVGRIAARDLGDSRLTDHFYAFTGTPGDVLITIETQNLNGDIDIFTAGSLRPVLKVGLYAEASSAVAKSFYLRQREGLILRVEARTPNDNDGIYHIRFGGSFEPIAGGPEESDETSANAETSTAPRRGKRVSSVGARINEPAPVAEVAAAPTPEPTPVATPETPVSEPKVEAPREATPKSTSARSRSGSRRSRNRPPTEATATTKPVTETEVKAPEDITKTEATSASSENAPAPRTRAPRKGKAAAAKKPTETSPTSEVEASAAKERDAKRDNETNVPGPAQGEAKLIIEMMDGSRLERSMSSVLRVTLESGQIVVTGTDGHVERIRLSRVLRMSIGQ